MGTCSMACRTAFRAREVADEVPAERRCRGALADTEHAFDLSIRLVVGQGVQPLDELRAAPGPRSSLQLQAWVFLRSTYDTAKS